MVPISPVPALALLYFYIITFRSMCAVPNMAVLLLLLLFPDCCVTLYQTLLTTDSIQFSQHEHIRSRYEESISVLATLPKQGRPIAPTLCVPFAIRWSAFCITRPQTGFQQTLLCVRAQHACLASHDNTLHDKWPRQGRVKDYARRSFYPNDAWPVIIRTSNSRTTERKSWVSNMPTAGTKVRPLSQRWHFSCSDMA
jgi:hypothetical protein